MKIELELGVSSLLRISTTVLLRSVKTFFSSRIRAFCPNWFSSPSASKELGGISRAAQRQFDQSPSQLNRLAFLRIIQPVPSISYAALIEASMRAGKVFERKSRHIAAGLLRLLTEVTLRKIRAAVLSSRIVLLSLRPSVIQAVIRRGKGGQKSA